MYYEIFCMYKIIITQYRQKPDMNLAALLKRHTTRTTFMHGTAMSPEDLNMVGVSMNMHKNLGRQ